MRHTLLACTLLLLLCITACKKPFSRSGDTGPDETEMGVPIPPAAPLTATLQGTVLTETGAPAAGASVTVGTRTVTTDSRGDFRITGASLDKNASLVKVEKAGYFKAYRSFAATSGANRVLIRLLPRTLAGTISGGSGGTITLGNGAQVELPGFSIITAATSDPYLGAVSVYATYVDPLATTIAETVPGSLMANNAAGKRVALLSYGMLAVELEGSAGEKLQLHSGSAARLFMPIPQSLRADAPESIPMWYLDESSGIWKEEGSASRQGTNYVGNVRHFSFWNADIGVNAVNLSLTLKGAIDSLPLANTPVKLTTTTTPMMTAWAWTDSLGQVSGLVPGARSLSIQVTDPCGNVAFSQVLGSFTQSSNFGTVYVNGTALVTVRGKLVDCNSAPVTFGNAVIHLGNTIQYAGTDAAGNFSALFFNCSGAGALQILPIDNGSQQQGSQVSLQLAAGSSTNVGSLSTCGPASEFFRFSLNGNNYFVGSVAPDTLDANTIVSSNGFSTNFSGQRIGGSFGLPNFQLRFSSAARAPGTYNLETLSANMNTATTIAGPSTVTLSAFPAAVGGFYEGSFTGSFRDATMVTTHQVNGTFRLRRRL
jgi:hypothetical protein